MIKAFSIHYYISNAPSARRPALRWQPALSRWFGHCTAFLALLLVGAQQAAAAPRPNVLFIVSDDLKNFLGCYDDPLAQTPNLDRLAARGVRFDRAYCTYPLCGPSRNSMLTGLYPNSTGIFRNAQIFRESIPAHVSLPQAFREGGYYVGRIGKLYHYNVPNSVGTDGHDDPASWELAMNPVGVDRLEEERDIFSLVPGSFGGVLSWLASPADDGQHTDGMIATEAEWVLDRFARQKDQPFFLAVGFFRPHTPYVAPRSYFDLYPVDRMPVVSGVKEDQADLPPAALGSYKTEWGRLTDDLRRQALQAYYASISFMDAQVGRVVGALERLGLADNTIIVFTSDHGYHTGEHGLWQKNSLFEESARVPLLIVAPGADNPGAVVRTPVSQVDLYPTLAALCGVNAPADLPGESLAPLLKDSSAKSRGWALTQVTRRQRRDASNPVAEGPSGYMGYSLRTARWRYTEWDEGKQGRELYDHHSDPKELTNLAAVPVHAATVARLSKQLQTATKSTFPASGRIPERNERPWTPQLRVR